MSPAAGHHLTRKFHLSPQLPVQGWNFISQKPPRTLPLSPASQCVLAWESTPNFRKETRVAVVEFGVVRLRNFMVKNRYTLPSQPQALYPPRSPDCHPPEATTREGTGRPGSPPSSHSPFFSTGTLQRGQGLVVFLMVSLEASSQRACSAALLSTR